MPSSFARYPKVKQDPGTVVEELDLELSFGEPKPSERNAGNGANAFESEEVLRSGAPLLVTDT